MRGECMYKQQQRQGLQGEKGFSVSDCFKTVLDIVDQIFHILQPNGQSKQIMTDAQLLPGGRG